MSNVGKEQKIFDSKVSNGWIAKKIAKGKKGACLWSVKCENAKKVDKRSFVRDTYKLFVVD